ncbi:unnamed protein product [Symbiodinium necroappetens]|uniref:Uncharacterized protein n=1 Tax=Symbiodinium necroappetens TaxID=1628268 RepID=A0A812U1W2_9DINO|nr:unnamed protein product [Symbiodinium necroappetens]
MRHSDGQPILVHTPHTPAAVETRVTRPGSESELLRDGALARQIRTLLLTAAGMSFGDCKKVSGPLGPCPRENAAPAGHVHRCKETSLLVPACRNYRQGRRATALASALRLSNLPATGWTGGLARST